MITKNDSAAHPTEDPVSDVGHWTQGLLRSAARSAPPDLASRLEEEWLAAAADLPRGLRQLRFALGCCWATRVITWEHAPAAAVAGGQTAAVDSPAGHFSQRTAVLLTIFGLHGLVIYGFATGLMQTSAAKLLPDRIQAFFIKQEPVIPLNPPPPVWKPIEARHTNWRPAPPTLGRIDVTSENPPPAYGPPEPIPPPSIASAQRVLGGPGINFPNTDAFYPSVARRLNEEGAVGVRVCVNPMGQLDGAPTVVQSSGNQQLDAGALRLAVAGSGHYRSTTESGQAIDSCFVYRVRFQLH